MDNKIIYNVSFSIFGKIVHIFDSLFKPLKKKLTSADMDIDYKKYGALAIAVFRLPDD